MDCFFFWDTKQELQVLSLPGKSLPVQAAILKNKTVVLTIDQIFEFAMKALVPKTIGFQFLVTHIAFSSSLTLLLTESSLWALGTDDSKSGLFGEDHLFSSEVPYRLAFFDSIPLLKVSVSSSHAAGITQDGQLYTWGSGTNGELGDLRLKSSKPFRVERASFFKSTEVCCGQKFTAVCTEAGFLFLFCKRKNCPKCKKTTSYPCTIDSIQNDFIHSIFAFEENLVITNDSGEVKLLDKCFCVNFLPSKGKLLEIASFDGGFVGFSYDRKFLHVWKQGSKAWVAESFHLDFGEVSKICSGPGKQVGIIGKKLSQRSLKKVKDSFVLDCSHRSAGDTERVSFDEIVSSLGFKGKINSRDQGKVLESIEKVYLKELKNVFQEIWKFSYSHGISVKSRNLASAGYSLNKIIEKIRFRLISASFKELYDCPKKKLNSFMALSNRFVSVSVEKYWNLWAALTRGYKQATKRYSNHLKLKTLKILVISLSFHQKSLIFSAFLALKSKKSRNFLKFFKILEKLLTFKTNLKKRKGFETLKYSSKLLKSVINCFPVKKGTLTQSSLPGIEIFGIPALSKTSLSLSVQSNSSEMEKVSLSKSLSQKSTQEKIQTKFSNSFKPESSNMVLDSLSCKTELSPELKSPSTPSLRSQMSQKIGEKPSKFPNIKLNQERSSSKTSAQLTARPPLRDNKKNVSCKEPLSPKVLMKKNTDDFSKRAATQKSQEVLTQALLRSSRMASFFKRCLLRVLKEALQGIFHHPSSSSKSAEPQNKAKNDPEAKTSQNSWKSKMFALAFNKLFKVISPHMARVKLESFVSLKLIKTR